MNPHIPADIAREEKVHIVSRRRKFGIGDNAPALGIALSGGGIRSATVSLGVFQYLAHEEKRVRDEIPAAQTTRSDQHAEPATEAATPRPEQSAPAPAAVTIPPRPRLLSRIDYLSSVSGGGYFATFFGSLFLPKDERAKGAQVTPEVFPAAVEGAPPPKTKWELAAERAADMLCDTIFDGNRMTPMRWLRENGRYLAPTGGGDYLYAAAVAVRNFVGLHYVIGVALLVVPISVGFFLAQTEFKDKRKRLNLPVITAIGIAVLCFIYAFAGEAPRLDWLYTLLQGNALPETSRSSPFDWGLARLAAAYIGFVAALSVIIYWVTKRRALQMVSEGAARPSRPRRRSRKRCSRTP